MLEDVKINVKIKLAALWVALMFFYTYGDILGFYNPGNISELIAGEIGGIPVTQELLLGFAILMGIPIFMIFLSLALKARVNRWANIIVGLVEAVILGATFWQGGFFAYYAVITISEAVLIALILWHAWKWPKQES